MSGWVGEEGSGIRWRHAHRPAPLSVRLRHVAQRRTRLAGREEGTLSAPIRSRERAFIKKERHEHFIVSSRFSLFSLRGTVRALCPLCAHPDSLSAPTRSRHTGVGRRDTGHAHGAPPPVRVRDRASTQMCTGPLRYPNPTHQETDGLRLAECLHRPATHRLTILLISTKITTEQRTKTAGPLWRCTCR